MSVVGLQGTYTNGSVEYQSQSNSRSRFSISVGLSNGTLKLENVEQLYNVYFANIYEYDLTKHKCGNCDLCPAVTVADERAAFKSAYVFM